MHNSPIQFESQDYPLSNRKTEPHHTTTATKDHRSPMKIDQNDNLLHSTLYAKQKVTVVKPSKQHTPGQEGLMKVTTTIAGSDSGSKRQVNQIQGKNVQLVSNPKQLKNQRQRSTQENNIRGKNLAVKKVSSSSGFFDCCLGKTDNSPNKPYRHMHLEYNPNAQNDGRKQQKTDFLGLICYYTKRLAEQDYQRIWSQKQLKRLLEELKTHEKVLERQNNLAHIKIIISFKHELVKYFYYHKNFSSALSTLEQILSKAYILEKQKLSILNMRIFRFIILIQITLENTSYATMGGYTNVLRQEYQLIQKEEYENKYDQANNSSKLFLIKDIINYYHIERQRQIQNSTQTKENKIRYLCLELPTHFLHKIGDTSCKHLTITCAQKHEKQTNFQLAFSQCSAPRATRSFEAKVKNQYPVVQRNFIEAQNRELNQLENNIEAFTLSQLLHKTNQAEQTFFWSYDQYRRVIYQMLQRPKEIHKMQLPYYNLDTIYISNKVGSNWMVPFKTKKYVLLRRPYKYIMLKYMRGVELRKEANLQEQLHTSQKQLQSSNSNRVLEEQQMLTPNKNIAKKSGKTHAPPIRQYQQQEMKPEQKQSLVDFPSSSSLSPLRTQKYRKRILEIQSNKYNSKYEVNHYIPWSHSLENIQQHSNYYHRFEDICGLPNLGNTCFMNSVLQCLFNSKSFHQAFGKELQQRLANNKEVGDLSFTYIRLLEEMKKNGQKQQQLKEIKHIVAQSNPIFEGYRQNDSLQFFNTFIIILRQELNNSNNEKLKKALQQQWDDDYLLAMTIQKDQSRFLSIIEQNFTGRYKTLYTCGQCNQDYRLFEKFNVHYVPLPPPEKYRWSDFLISSKPCYLTQCLRAAEEPDYLLNDNAMTCDHCESNNKTSKKTTRVIKIYQPNKILVIGLKRFHEGQKNDRPVKVPLTLSIEEVVPNGSYKKQYKDKGYILYGAILHRGSLHSGHYTSICRDKQGQWRNYSDSHVREITEPYYDDLQNAYGLFYELEDINESELKQRVRTQDNTTKKHKPQGYCGVF